MAFKSPIHHLISVNKTPDRATMLVAQMVSKLQDDYHIVHVANSSSACPKVPLFGHLSTAYSSSNSN